MGRGGVDGSVRSRRGRTDSPASGEKQEMLIDGRLYDVTEFRRRHPGGRVINFYMGADATEPFYEFHCRSRKATKILKSLPSRPYDDKPLTDDLVSEFAELRNQLREEGFYDPAPLHIAYRLFELVAMHAFGAWLVYSGWFYTGLLLLGIAQGRCGWLMHEGGHYSLTGVPAIDVQIQMLVYGLGCGMSGAWWRNQHNKHHATPQKLGHDVDLDTLPLVCFHVDIAKLHPKLASKFWLRLQGALFAPVTCLLVALGWQYYLHPRHVLLRTKNVTEMFWMGLRMAILIYLGTQYGGWTVLRAFLIYDWIGAMYIFCNFAVSHTHLPVVPADEHRDWVRYAAEHTMNVQGSWWCNWWMAYLNFQIEHHLFPCMPQFRHPRASPRVKALFEKHGLEYLTRSYWDAMRVTFTNLHNVGQEVFYG